MDLWSPLIKHGITMNQMYIVDCIVNKIRPLEKEKFLNLGAEINIMIINGWLTDDKQLTVKAIEAHKAFMSTFKRIQKKIEIEELGEDFANHVKKFQEIFPNQRLPSGKAARGNIEDCKRKFKEFFIAFPTYANNWELIYKAAQKYVDEYKQKNYEYMKTCQYFIMKDKTSELADFCELVNSGTDEGDNYDQRMAEMYW